MKTAILLLVLSSPLLSGCNGYLMRAILPEPEPKYSAYENSSKNIIVYTSDTISTEYALLSIRGDSAIVVIDPTERENPEIMSYTRAILLKKDTIKRIIQKSHGGPNKAIGALTGLALGLIVDAAIIRPSRPPYNDSKDLFGLDFAVYYLLDPALGMVLGGFIGTYLPTSIELSLASAEDRGTLKSLALFPYGEPAIMQYIK